MSKRSKVVLITVISTIALLAGAFLIYAANYYKADETALAVMQDDTDITVEGDLVILSPGNSSDTALIFYPGAKVEYLAYLPILEKIKERCHITCILVKMPFNMAVFYRDAADKVIEEFPDIEHWYIGGHSMGGAMASSYASNNKDKIQGLILMGAYIYGDYPEEDALTVYGTFNTSVAEKIDYTENIIVIEGGNHAQFGNYGRQRGDPDAMISSETQQDITVDAIRDFLNRKND